MVAKVIAENKEEVKLGKWKIMKNGKERHK
jgi:hypothetical protein